MTTMVGSSKFDGFDSPTAGHAQPDGILKGQDYMLATMTVISRPGTQADLPAITRIYGHAVRHGTGTFETQAPDEAEMARRREAVLGNGWPFLVAESGGAVLGFAYANAFRPRLAYRFCLEDSIYLDEHARGRGVGRLLLAELLSQCEARGARQMLAVIGDAANAGSVGVHRACGFEDVGAFKAAGWKFGRWLDVVLMQKALGEGASSAPRDR
jgi:L-amino acid N-acyltransferase YncA